MVSRSLSLFALSVLRFLPDFEPRFMFLLSISEVFPAPPTLFYTEIDGVEGRVWSLPEFVETAAEPVHCFILARLLAKIFGTSSATRSTLPRLPTEQNQNQ